MIVIGVVNQLSYLGMSILGDGACQLMGPKK